LPEMRNVAIPKDELILDLWRVGAIKFGSFTLKSKVTSPFYIDLRVLAAYPRLLRSTARAMSNITKTLKFDRIAGIPYAGLPLAVIISQELDVPLIYPRKEAKNYGSVRRIEGIYSVGETIVVVDDVITDGQSKMEAIEPLKEAGLMVKDIVILIDRQQGGVSRMAEKGYSLTSVTTMSEVLTILKKLGAISDTEFEESLDHIHKVQF
jgi:uridine monophosphate synthetase